MTRFMTEFSQVLAQQPELEALPDDKLAELRGRYWAEFEQNGFIQEVLREF